MNQSQLHTNNGYNRYVTCSHTLSDPGMGGPKGFQTPTPWTKSSLRTGHGCRVCLSHDGEYII